MAPAQPITDLQRFALRGQFAAGRGVVDLCALELGFDAKVAADRDFTFFNERHTAQDAVRLTDDALIVDTSMIGAAVHSVLLCAAMADAGTFGSLRHVDGDHLLLADQHTKAELAAWRPDQDFAAAGAVVLGCAHRGLGGWTFTPIARAFPGLAEMAQAYGVDVD
jgi:stress response protein SCP2